MSSFKIQMSNGMSNLQNISKQYFKILTFEIDLKFGL